MLIVEDGTIVEGAESYVSLTDAEAYFDKFGSPAEWVALTEAQKEAALRYGTRYVDGLGSFIGSVISLTQPRMWPRATFNASQSPLNPLLVGLSAAAVGPDGRIWQGVPSIVKDATCEAALSHVRVAMNRTIDGDGRVTKKTVSDLSAEMAVSAIPHVYRQHIAQILAPVRSVSGFTVVATRRV